MKLIPLGDVASLSTGYPFRKKVESEEGGDITLVYIKDIHTGEGAAVIGDIKLRNEGDKFERYLLRKGDLLFQSRGSRHPAAVVGSVVSGIAATGLHMIRPDEGRVSSEFLVWWLNHPRSQQKLTADVARGTYVPFVSKTDLEAFLVPLPPLDLQAKVVAVHKLRQQEKRLTDQLDRLVQQVVDVATFEAATSEKRRN